MAKCPNTSHPDWKALVEKYGENGAWKRYIDNNHEIPNADSSVSNKRTKVSISKSFDAIGDFFSSKSTLDTIDKNPELLPKMIDELRILYPWININKGFIVDDQGNKVEIPAGKKGMHYRSALTSAIAYANDSYLETVPHEYAHEYIDMYRNTPLVRKAIEKYGEERLVTLIGRKYTGQKMSNSFEKFINEFWKMIRRTFGAPSIVDTLTDSFAKNEALGTPLARGSAIYNYQDIQEPLTGKEKITDYNQSIEGASKENTSFTDEQAEAKIFNELNFKFDPDVSMDEQENRFNKWWGILAGMISKEDNNEGVDSNLVTYVNTTISDVNNKRQIIAKIRGEQVELTKGQQQAYEYILDLKKASMHRVVVNNSYLNQDENKLVDKEVVDKQLDSEVGTTMDKRKANMDSKSPVMRWAAEQINKVLSQITNTRLWAKYLSGSENSLFSNIMYKGLNNGRVPYAKYFNAFQDFFTSTPNSYFKGSIFHNKGASISELETETIVLDQKLNQEIDETSVQLTKSEMLMIYLMARQEDGMNKLEKGIYLNEIKGRDLNLNNKYKLTEAQIKAISEKVANDSEVIPFIEQLDKAMEYSHSELNKVHKQLEGYDLRKIENYFPMFHGPSNSEQRKSKNVIDDMRSFRKRMDEAGALRLEDPFKVLSGLRMSNASYVGYAIPIHNAKNAIKAVKGKYKSRDTVNYIRELEGTIDKIQDSGLLFSTQGETKTSQMINKLQGNFAVALLAKNLGVVFKQQISLETAATEINRKYIRKSGASLGGLNFINPIDLVKRLSVTGISGGKTMMPVEWTQITESENFQELMEDPLFRNRAEGMTSRETGEAIMGEISNNDRIKVPFIKDKNGNPIEITKSRLMMGITIMDTLTILRIYAAVKLETQDRMNEPKFSNLTAEQIKTHNIARLQEIVDKTQPTFDQTNRTGMARNSNPIFRALTMFSSATQKMQMQMLDTIVDYVNNPTAENRNKMGVRFFHTAITTSIMLTTIDLLWYGLRHGWDDDDWNDDLVEKYMLGAGKTTLGSIHGFGSAYNVMVSQLDSNPWYQTIQDPYHAVIQEGAESAANLAKGNFLKATKGAFNTSMKIVGAPVVPVNNALGIIDAVTD